MNFQFEFAKPSDAKELLEIYTPYILETTITFEYEVPSIEEFQQRITNISSFYPYLVCKDNGKIVGYAYAARFKERAAFQWDVESSIYLDADYQGQGIATMLYERLLALLTLQGFHRIYALISVPNEASTHLHEKFGFKNIGIYKKSGYKFNQWCDLLTMDKAINEGKEPGTLVGIPNLPAAQVQSILTKGV